MPLLRQVARGPDVPFAHAKAQRRRGILLETTGDSNAHMP